MKERILGKDLKVSAVGLGCMGMTHAYGPPKTPGEIRELLAQAVDLDYSFFDTAEIYGTADDPGLNETLVGEALAPYRQRVVIGTKFGVAFDRTAPGVNKPVVPDARRGVILKSVDGSLARLKTDHIDIYYQHRQDPSVPVEEVALVMADLIREGKILRWGLSEADEDTVRRAHGVCPLTAVQNRYSMMARWHEKMFDALEELGISLVAFSPLANGILSGAYSSSAGFDPELDYRSAMAQFTDKAMEENRDLFRLLKDLALEKNATMGQISLAWMLGKKSWIVPIPGTTSPSRLRENAGAAEVELARAEVDAIDRALDSMRMSDVFGGARIVRR